MRSRSGDLRLFVSVRPPAEVVASLFQSLRDAGAPEGRDTPAEQVHLTLQFIGNVRRSDLDGAIESVQRAAKGLAPFEAYTTGLITLPECDTPRLLAASIEPHPTLLELHRRLARSFARAPRKDPSDRFTPHMTLRRFERGKPAERVSLPLKPTAFAVRSILLVRSVLTPQGADHRTVHETTLGDEAPLQ